MEKQNNLQIAARKCLDTCSRIGIDTYVILTKSYAVVIDKKGSYET